MNTIKKYWVVIVLITSVIAISIALIAEYFFEILPCKMCLYQRYPYYFIIIFSLVYFFTKKTPLAWYYWIINFSFIIGLFISLWHVGIEQKILPGLSGCTNDIEKTNSLTNLKDQILKQNVISCDEIVWSFMGISAATLNSLLLILLLLVNTKFLMQSFYDNEKI